VLNTKFSPWPSYTSEEAEAIASVLLSNKVNYWTGNECREFEKEFASFTNTQYAVALANGTVALEAALIGLGIGEGAEVVVTPRTYIASASSIVTVGAKPVFADVNLNSQNITAETIRSVLTPSTKAIIVVHLAGYPCDMDPIMELARERSLFVIEDCAQAHGAVYKGRPVGGIGHVGAWSFCQDKIMTTGGEGGMVTTNDKSVWQKIWEYKDIGRSWDAVYNREHPPGFRWIYESFGTNWRLTEMQAVIGRIQLKRMTEWNQRRAVNANRILSSAKDFPVFRVPSISSDNIHAWYKCYLFVESSFLRDGWSRDKIVEAINDRGVPCYQGSCSEVYLEKAFDSCGRPENSLVHAKELGETSLMFLVHPTLTEDELDLTCRVIEEVGAIASKNL